MKGNMPYRRENDFFRVYYLMYVELRLNTDARNPYFMSLFKDSKIMGLAVIIIALVFLVTAVVSIVTTLTGDAEGDAKLAGILTGIGSVIVALIYFAFGSKVRKGEFSNGMDLLAKFVQVIAVVTLVQAVFSIPSWADVVLNLIIGVIIYWCYMKIADGKKTVSDKVIWIVLLVLFILALIGSVISIFVFTIPAILAGVCGIILYGFMVALLLDSEVKNGMGM